MSFYADVHGKDASLEAVAGALDADITANAATRDASDAALTAVLNAILADWRPMSDTARGGMVTVATVTGAMDLILRNNAVAVTTSHTLDGPIFIKAAELPAINAKTAHLRLRLVVQTNDVAPGQDLTLSLYPITVSGTVGNNDQVLGTKVPGADVTLTAATLIAQDTKEAVGASIALPADGDHVLVVHSAGAFAAASSVAIRANIEVNRT